MKTIAIVPCSKQKNHPANRMAAKDLYTGSMFKKAMACAESMKPDAIYILSAKFHLVTPTDELPYYDRYLSKLSANERREWAKETLREMKEKGIDLKNDKIIFLTGRDYYINLIGEIKNYSIIGEGLPIGKKMQEFIRITNNKKHN